MNLKHFLKEYNWILDGCLQAFLVLVWCVIIPAVTIYFFCKVYFQ